MNRDEYITKIIALAKLKFQLTQAEVEEFRLLLEMMPDKGTDFTPEITPGVLPNVPYTPARPSTSPYKPWRDVILMYGCEISGPYSQSNDIVNVLETMQTSTTAEAFIDKENKTDSKA